MFWYSNQLNYIWTCKTVKRHINNSVWKWGCNQSSFIVLAGKTKERPNTIFQGLLSILIHYAWMCLASSIRRCRFSNTQHPFHPKTYSSSKFSHIFFNMPCSRNNVQAIHVWCMYLYIYEFSKLTRQSSVRIIGKKS